MMNLIVWTILSAVSFAQSEAQHSVTGKIEFEESLKDGDDVYIFVSSQRSSIVVSEKSSSSENSKEKGAKVEAPKISNRWILVGRKYGKNIKFDVSLKKGSYQLGCLVKKSKPDCTEISLNREKIITQCFPGKDDSICDQIQVEVVDRNVYDLILRAGSVEMEKP